MSKEGQTRAPDSAYDTEADDIAAEQKAESRLPPPLLAQVKRLGPADAEKLRALLAANPQFANDIVTVAGGPMGNSVVVQAVNGKEDAKYAAMSAAQHAETPAHKPALTPEEQAAMLNDPSDAKAPLAKPPAAAGPAAASPEQAATSPHTFSGPGQGRVTATGLNVRLTPDASGHDNIIGGLHRGNDVQVVGRQGAWLSIVFEGGPAFVHGAFVEVSPAKSAEQVAAAQPPAPVVPPPPAPSAPAHPAHPAATEHPPAAAPKAIEAVKSAAPPEAAAHIEDKVSKPEAAPPAAPAPAPAAHATAPAPAPAAPAAAHTTPAAPTASATPPSSAPSAPAFDSPEYKLQLIALSTKLVFDLDDGHVDQAGALKQFTEFDQKHGGGSMTPVGLSLLGGLIVSLTQHEIAREKKLAAQHPHTDPAKPAATAPAATSAPAAAPHVVAPAGHDKTAGTQVWTLPAGAKLDDATIDKLAAKIHDPKVGQLMTDLGGVVSLAAKLYKHREGKEFVGPDRENLVAGIATVHAELAGLDAAGDPASLAEFRVAVNHKLEESAPYHSQVNIRTIETGAYTTCNVTSLAMALEATGRNADNYKAAKLPQLLAVAEMYSADVAKAKMTSHGNETNFASLRGLRFPDFMEFAAIAWHLKTDHPTPEEIKAAAIAAAGDKTHLDVLAGIAADFGASADPEYMSFGGAAGNKALKDFANDHHAQADEIADARNAGDTAKYKKLSAQTPLEGGDIEQKVALADYKAKIMATIKPQLDGGAGIIAGCYGHFTSCFGVFDDHIMIHDPGQYHRSERKLLWPEARALQFFWNYLVVK